MGVGRFVILRTKSRPFRVIIGPVKNDATRDCLDDGTVVVSPPSIVDRKPLFDGDDWPGGERGRDDAASLKKKREWAIIIKKA